MRLLVSVRDVEEAISALRGGAHIIDVKNPEEGSLGAHHPAVIRGVSMVICGGTEVSATLGDLPNLPGTASLAALGAAVSGVNYVKAGLFGAGTPGEAKSMLRAICRAVEGYGVKVIAAGYADYKSYGCINPMELPLLAHDAGAHGVMIDIRGKGSGGKIFEHLCDEHLRAFVREAHRLNLVAALAGGLDVDDVSRVYALGVDIMGVRRGVCKSGGKVDEAAVRGIVEEIRRVEGSRRRLIS